MSREFHDAKITLLDTDPRIMPAVIHVWGKYERFEYWLEHQHTCTAARAFDIIITKRLVKDLFAFLGSLIGALSLLVLKQLTGVEF